MKPNDKRLEHIDELESWFRGVCSELAGPDVPRIQEFVRLAVQEEWLNRQLREPDSEDWENRIQGRVRAALAEQQSLDRAAQGESSSLFTAGGRVRWAIGSVLAAAACLLFYVGLRVPADRMADSPYVASFENFVEDEMDHSLASLDEDIEEVEIAYDSQSSDPIEFDEVDELWDHMDHLFSEEDFEDWS